MQEESKNNGPAHQSVRKNTNKARSTEKAGLKVRFFKSIRFRVWASMLLLAFFPLIFLGAYAFNMLEDMSRSIMIESNIQAFQQVKYEISQYVKNYEDLVKYMASDVRLTSEGGRDREIALQQLDKAYEYIERIVICDKNGNLITHSKLDKDTITGLTVPEKMLAAMPGSMLFSPEAFHVKADISNSADDGMVIATVSFLKLRKSLENLTVGTNFTYYLITQNGENVLLQPNFPKELIAALMESPCGAYDILSADGTTPPQIAISLPILQYNLRIIVLQTAADVYSLAAAIGRRVFRFIIYLALAALILALWFGRTLTNPIIEAAKRFNEVSEGNLDVPPFAASDDEIGLLSKCFNNMTASIKIRMFELSTLYKITNIIATASTYQQAVDDCLKYLVSVFKAERGSIMTLSEDKTFLSTASFYLTDSSEKVPSHVLKLKVGEGIAGKAAESLQPILCTDCKTDERFKEYPDSTGCEAPQTLISVPMMVRNSLTGVLNLTNRSNSKTFTANDQNLLTAIVNQMSFSMENARLREVSVSDDLTGLYVKNFYELRLEDEIKRARRFNFALTLALFEIDGFDDLVEKHGQKTADTILFETAKVLKDSVRGTDIPAYLGKGRFGVILAHTNTEQATIFAERLQKKTADEKIETLAGTLSVTISMGLCQYSKLITRQFQFTEKAADALSKSQSQGCGKLAVIAENEKQ